MTFYINPEMLPHLAYDLVAGGLSRCFGEGRGTVFEVK
jgi:hypothetical protein